MFICKPRPKPSKRERMVDKPKSYFRRRIERDLRASGERLNRMPVAMFAWLLGFFSGMLITLVLVLIFGGSPCPEPMRAATNIVSPEDEGDTITADTLGEREGVVIVGETGSSIDLGGESCQ